MAFTVTSLGSVGDTTARSDQTCSIFRAPASNALILVSVLVSDVAGTPVEPSAVSGAGLIFSLVTSSVTHDTIASATKNLSVWRGMGSGSIVSSVITANFSNNNSGCAMLVAEVQGVDTSGTSGSGAISQSATTRADSSSAVTVIAPSATSTGNAWFAVGSGAISSTESAGVSTQKFTEIDRIDYATPSTAIYSAWTTKASCTSVELGGGGADERAGIMVELVLATPAGAGTTGLPLGRTFRLVTVPSTITGPVGNLLRLWERQLNGEVYISKFSGTDPNTSGVTGIPGQMVMNVGSASSFTRLWVMAGSVASISTTSWHPCRVA